MSIQLNYKDWEIKLFNEHFYSIKSTDNIRAYDYTYFNEGEQRYSNDSQHGIEVYFHEDLIKSAIIISGGGATNVHESCFVIDEDRLLICCANSLFCLELPFLKLLWQANPDHCTCFQIFKHGNGFIIHGELDISKLDINRNVIWTFAGNDIFTTPTGEDTFKIINDVIYAENWDNVIFELNANTGALIKADNSKSFFRPK